MFVCPCYASENFFHIYGTVPHTVSTVRHGIYCVRYGTVRYSTARSGTARYGTAQHGTVQHGTIKVRHGTVRYGTAPHGTPRYDTAPHSAARYGGLRDSTARHSTVLYGTTTKARCGMSKVPHQGYRTARDTCMSTTTAAPSHLVLEQRIIIPFLGNVPHHVVPRVPAPQQRRDQIDIVSGLHLHLGFFNLPPRGGPTVCLRCRPADPCPHSSCRRCR